MGNSTEEDLCSQTTNRDDGDILTILVATDIHLGFEEKDPIRDQDTYDTFEEILKIASAEEVDFILLGGDLFHHSRPSPYCIFKCTELLRRYCLGDKPVEIEFLSDPSRNFHNVYNPTVNYEDPNLNVSIPVFSIHGNHDDPTGQKQISAMDLMSTSGLINYFGRWNNFDKVEVEPILLKKGATKLALYGLSHIKDERLGRLFLDKKVKMMAPEDQDDWFHLLVWHQNRATRGVKNFIPDDSLPDFLDLVIWGHEHDCRIEPERKHNDVYVSQPGSSVATSLAAGEAIPKKVGILKVHHKQFQMIPVDLKTVRPFIFEELVLKNLDDMMNDDNSGLTPNELTLEVVTKKVESMMEEAKQLGRVGKASEKPLIRLNVKCRDERQVFNAIRFGQQYNGRVANPDDMVKCQPIKEPVRRGKGDGKDKITFNDGPVLADRVEDIISKYFAENDTLKGLSIGPLNEGVKRFIDSNNADAVSDVAEFMIKETIEYLATRLPEIEEAENMILACKTVRDEQENLNTIRQVLDKPQKKRSVTNDDVSQRKSSKDDDDGMTIDDDDDDDSNASASPVKGKGLWGDTSNSSKPTRGPGSRGGRGSRGPRRARGKGRAN
ncbi:unnamed protein product [Phaedon cochleariae]|uniref:Double-strand break repair protein n=1 Tax=Phaedon cochleariae TaxID=80249 RepID=A0A9P0GUD9_PHACE|nr:unnamed protein product [Phaedon cochleariae]